MNSRVLLYLFLAFLVMPTLVIGLVGIPASGKSTLATALKSSLCASSASVSVISFDDIEARIAVSKPQQASVESWRQAREEALRTVAELLSMPSPPGAIIVDDTSHLRSMRKALHRVCCEAKASARLFWIYVKAGREEAAERDKGRDKPVGRETLDKVRAHLRLMLVLGSCALTHIRLRQIFDTMQEPGTRGRDGVPVFERGNVLEVTSESNPEEVASLLMASKGYDTTPKAAGVDSGSSRDPQPPPPPPPFHPDQTLRTLVSAAVSISKDHAGAANAARKDLLKASPPLADEASTVSTFCAALPQVDEAALLEAYEAKKWSAVSDSTSGLAKSKVPFTDSEVWGVAESLRLAGGSSFDQGRLAALVREAGHLSHKDWQRTLLYGKELEGIVGR